jgi:pyridoxal phosphate enzyme (YggS family)
MPRDADIASNLDLVRRRIAAAAHRVGRDPADITLVAVSKNVPPDRIRLAIQFDQRVFGENRVQELVSKMDALAPDPAAQTLDWHLIGHLQSNKARKVASAVGWIESLDRQELLVRLDRAAGDSGVRPSVLIQVDLAREPTKHGIPRDELRPLVEAALDARSLDLKGLMTVPPYGEDPEQSRPWFRELCGLRDELVAEGYPAERLGALSMGMSHDFEVAIEEGATIVRIGTAIFGSRPSVATGGPT